MARIRVAFYSEKTLPLPKREQDFKDKGRRRRERLRDKRYKFRYEMVRSDGRGYEPPRRHPVPFSTRQTYLA